MRAELASLTSEQVRGSMIRIDEPTQGTWTKEMARDLGNTVFFQEPAMQSLAQAVGRLEAGLNNPRRPLGVFLFSGPTGVGKTEAAKALARNMFGGEQDKHLKILDCGSLFAEDHNVLRLTGAPPSYIGHNQDPLLTPDFLKNRNIIVFDEIEKGAPGLHRALLTIMEEGRLTATINSKQGVLDFTNSVIVLTTNIGAERMHKSRKGQAHIGLQTGAPVSGDLTAIGQSEIKNYFKAMPEFLSRIDSQIVFADLPEEAYELIYTKFLDEINSDLQRGNEQAPYIGTTLEFRDWLLSQVDREYGARDIRHTIDKLLLPGITDLLLDGVLAPSAPVVADIEEGKVVYYTDLVEVLPQEEEVAFEGEKKAELLPLAEAQPVESDQLGNSSGDSPGGRDHNVPNGEEELTDGPRDHLSPPYDDPADPWNGIPHDEQHRDPGDETDRPIKLGIKLTVWDEGKVDSQGEVQQSYVVFRNLPLP